MSAVRCALRCARCARLRQVLDGRVGELEAHLAGGEAAGDARHLEAHDALDLRLAQRLENDVLVHAVHKLRPEVRAHLRGEHADARRVSAQNKSEMSEMSAKMGILGRVRRS
jgi:hypothetical protein